MTVVITLFQYVFLCSSQRMGTAYRRDVYFDVLLTVHLSITLANDQLDAQFFYFITRLLQSSTCFEQRRAHHQEVKWYQYSIWYRHSL